MKELKLNEIIELTPQEAQEYNKLGYVLLWLDKDKHSEGLPKIRKYQCLGRNTQNQNKENEVSKSG